MILVLSFPEIKSEKVDAILKEKNINNINTNEESFNNYRHFLSTDWVVDPSVKYTEALILGFTLVSNSFLDQVISVVQVHSKVTIKYIIESESEIEENLSSLLDAAEVEMKLCGLLSVEMKTESSCSFEISGIKPNLSQGTSLRRPLKRPVVVKDALKAVLLSSSEPVSLLDDSDLLKEEDLIKPNVNSESAEECGPMAKKKACKNCSCGLKELEESTEDSKTVVIDTANVKSSCGSVN